jgi:hypothetical protein
MRTTIYISDALFAEVEKLAAESRTTVTALIEDALRERLARRQNKSRLKSVQLTTFGKNGLQPGVDLDDSAALLELMEGGRDTSIR